MTPDQGSSSLLTSQSGRAPSRLDAALRRRSSDPEDDLADFIEADGRDRLERGEHLELAAYLEALPDLPQRPVALDAAIDVVLRSLAPDCSGGVLEAGQILCDNYPDLQRPIREAVALHDALMSTNGMRKRASGPAPRTPQEFGQPCEQGPRYVVRELLGAGAAGDVYLAIDRLLSAEDAEALVAAKVLRLSDDGAAARQRLADEATRARRVHHPNVVRVTDRGLTDRGDDFVIMEYAPGGTLLEWREDREADLTPETIAEIVEGIASGVHAIHTAGLVHCDLKPDNIVLDAEGAPKITDFGLALRGGDDRSVSGSAHPLGNLAFMSPEQFRMEDGALAPSADIYALGGLLYWLLTGQLPNGGSRQEVARAHRTASTEPRPGFGERCAVRVDRDLEAICRRALHPDPEQRYGSAIALAEDLGRWRRREPIPWTKPSLVRTSRLWMRRRPGQAVLVVLLVSVIIGGAVVAGRFSTVAERKALEAELVASRLDKREGDFDQLRGGLHRYIAIRNAGKEGRPVGQLLLDTAPLLFWAAAPEFAESTVVASVEDLNSKLIPDVIAALSNQGGPRSLEAITWRTILGFCHLRAHRPERAIEILEAVEADARAVLLPNDGWLNVIEAIRTCAQVDQRRVAIRAQDRLPSVVETREMLARLTHAERLLEDRPPASGFRDMVMRVRRVVEDPIAGGPLDPQYAAADKAPPRPDAAEANAESTGDQP